ncbi:MAG: NAD(P)-dependent oxidoreductase [Kordiimonadaceae bacterium]|nr:NAD(P)-dependent oxidoreductase [Kordiimonadaceae bacterium]MBO6568432.1 NAD(P)-dependent oxidoreductase [Kordiimonadaceae bacterium]MBO6963839.1 NAD(P)-dependent oxidoreductase [Kordiimonadaceae bacterium]
MKSKSGILLTGANGAVGKRLFRLLEANGYSVWPCVRTEDQAREWRSHCKRTIVTDLGKLSTLPDQVGHIIHAAASPVSPEQFEADNINATVSLAELAARSGIRSFVFFSAVSVYGTITDSVVDETTALDNPGAYGLSKLAGEDIVLAQRGHFVPVVLRLPGIIGAGSHRNWLSRVKDSLAVDSPVRYFNGESAFNNAVHMEDLASLCGDIIGTECEGGIYTLAAAGTLRVKETLQIMASAIGSKSELQEMPTSQQSWTISSKKAVKNLGYRPMRIERMIEKFAKERF